MYISLNFARKGGWAIDKQLIIKIAKGVHQQKKWHIRPSQFKLSIESYYLIVLY